MSHDATDPSDPSRPSKETNSVRSPDGQTDEFDELVHERVLEFQAEYPELAETPLSRTHGRKLRRIVTEPEWRDALVESDNPTEAAFGVTELKKREAATWADALSAFLTAHTEYEGLLARFAKDDGSEEFEIPLADAWGEEYSKKQYARALALQRQMGGGERPSGGEAVAAWDDPATAMLTLTGSSIPDGNRVPPVDHLDAIHDSFSYNGVRDTLRNTVEYHLDLGADEWGYWLQAEPHAMGAADDPETEGGANACYTHLHVGVYFDAGALRPDLREDLDAVGAEFERVIDKHVQECEFAAASAHDYTTVADYEEESRGCISLNANVQNMGSYMASYMGGYTEELLEKPIEYVAWGALYWSAARRRTSRSKVLNAAIEADACEQRAESEESHQTDGHGEKVRWDDGNGLDVVCRCCGSGWSIAQDRLDEPTSDAEVNEAIDKESEESTDHSFSELWADADAGARIGESPDEAAIRTAVEDRLAESTEVPSVPQLLGELSIDPGHAQLVANVIDGQEAPESEAFRRAAPIESEWHLEAIVDRDGEEHEPGDGGVDTVPLHLPARRLLQETRLQYDRQAGEMFRCSRCNVATSSQKQMARHFAWQYGIEDPEVADRLLIVEDYYDNDRPCMQHPGNS